MPAEKLSKDEFIKLVEKISERIIDENNTGELSEDLVNIKPSANACFTCQGRFKCKPNFNITENPKDFNYS